MKVRDRKRGENGTPVPPVAVRKAGSEDFFRLEVGGTSFDVMPAEERKEPPSLSATFVPSGLRKRRDIADAIASDYATREFLHDASAAKLGTQTLQEKYCALSLEERQLARACAKMVARDSWEFLLEFCLNTDETLLEYRSTKENLDRALALPAEEKKAFTLAKIDAVCADGRMAEKLVKAWMLHEEARKLGTFLKAALDTCDNAGIRGACSIAFKNEDVERHDLFERLKQYAALDRTCTFCNALGPRGSASGEKALAKQLVDTVASDAANGELVDSLKGKRIAELRRMVDDEAARTGIRYIRLRSGWAVLQKQND